MPNPLRGLGNLFNQSASSNSGPQFFKLGSTALSKQHNPGLYDNRNLFSSDPNVTVTQSAPNYNGGTADDFDRKSVTTVADGEKFKVTEKVNFDDEGNVTGTRVEVYNKETGETTVTTTGDERPNEENLVKTLSRAVQGTFNSLEEYEKAEKLAARVPLDVH